MNLTEFTIKVYRVVSRIPLGQVRTYKWVAKEAGYPGAYRAVGTVLKKNPYPLIIPCHRVVKSNKTAGDYTGGKKRKIELLELERQIARCLANKE